MLALQTCVCLHPEPLTMRSRFEQQTCPDCRSALAVAYSCVSAVPNYVVHCPRWEFGCTTGTTTVKEVGSCFGQGTTDKGVTYSETNNDATTKDNRATVTFTW
jgi:hypothetical protein